MAIMLAKRNPMIEKLSVSSRNGVSDTVTSPRSPLEYKSQSPSPRGTKSYEIGGVGLGIAVALEKPIMSHEVLAKYALISPRSRRSAPIPVRSGRNGGGIEEMEVDDSENYTYVTCHRANKSFTKVYYYDGCDVNTVFDRRCDHLKEVKRNPVSDFLSCCDLCKKNLHGKDIYMYRGEKAFCSTECRSRQIALDELKEQRTRSADLSSSPYSNRDEIFSTGILAI